MRWIKCFDSPLNCACSDVGVRAVTWQPLDHFATLRINDGVASVMHPREKSLEVKIYTKPGCPYCAKAREFYTERGIAFQEFNAQDNMKFREEMLSISNGDPTVPVIVENGRLKQIGWEGRG